MTDLFRRIGLTNLVGMLAGIFTAISMLPQLVKTFKKKKSEEISLFMLVILNTGIATWIYYGILRKDDPIIFNNAFSFLINFTLLILHFKYKKKDYEFRQPKTLFRKTRKVSRLILNIL
jgi:MtN3 and saliva related transmembrane protein